jgi:hypothetical protein
VQTGLVAQGAEVRLSGVVTALAPSGIVLQEPAGGPRSGVWVTLGAGWEASWGPLVEGDLVEVTGLLDEQAGTAVDLQASAVPALLDTGEAPVPPAQLLTAAALAASPEDWEGVLVELQDVVVDSFGGGNRFLVSDLGGSDTVGVDDTIALFGGYPTLLVGQRLDRVVGPVVQDVTGVSVAPRRDEDVQLAVLSLRINEVLADPPQAFGDANCDGVRDGAQDAFVEIWNAGTEPVELTGLELSDNSSVRHLFGSGTLGPSEALVVFGGGAAALGAPSASGTWCETDPLVQVASTGSLGLTPSGDTIELASGAWVLDVLVYGGQGAQQASVNRNPDLGAGAPIRHDLVPGASTRLSPGALVTDLAAPYTAAIGVDGDPADWPADALFTHSGGDQSGVSWSQTHLYLTLTHPLVEAGPECWVVAYFGTGAPGGTEGYAIGAQSPALPFTASRGLRWACDDSANGLLVHDGTSWTETVGWFGSNGSWVVDSGTTVEIALPLDALDPVRSLDVVMAIVDATPGAERTVAATPSAALTDGALDPDYGAHLSFTPALPGSPTSYPVVP